MPKKKEENIQENEKKYTTLLHDGYAELEEKKSVFIGHARHVESAEEAVAFVREIREKYPDATHNVYAYMLGSSTTRYSDDGEPQGTAGLPVLDIIRKTGFTDAAIVVTRYFGGTLLGTGGLVRAYSETARMAVMNAEIAGYESYTVFSVRCSYSDYQKIQNEISHSDVITDNTEFAGDVFVTLAMKKNCFEAFSEKITEMTSARAIIKYECERNELVK